MMAISHVLVPYDGSLHSQRALERAAALAEGLQAELEILYVDSATVDELRQPLIMTSSELEAYFDHKEDEVRRNLREMISRIPNAKTVIICGSAAKGIVDYSMQSKPDLIIMGSRGLNTMGEFMKGSVSRYVTQRASAPVMIVK
ncbi:universal stress protein [Paenibacillus hunanensis]|uniref:universal stress protein n=1 Tax=Paenibacillus hunanensis TaxID=539262 RepID=UPI002A6B8950|nr:universal stress protein [Paenibacillus hunanensis]WPP39395.1 universal stress protein [Paenibacillus hunanensis]